MRTALLFPGQGAYERGVLGAVVAESAAADAVLDRVEEVGREFGYGPLRPFLCTRDAGRAEPPPSDLLIFATSVTAYTALTDRGFSPDLLIGHSFGEWAAFACAGAVEIEDAVRMICERITILQEFAPEGGMLALNATEARARHLIGLLDDPSVSLAVDNGPDQTVLSGPHEALERAARIATATHLRSTRLAVRLPFHNGHLLAATARRLERSALEAPVRRPLAPCYSALLGRAVDSPNDVREIVLRHLTDQVHFREALLHAYQRGVRRFVECGARNVLTGLVRAGLPRGAVAVAPWAVPGRDWHELLSVPAGTGGLPEPTRDLPEAGTEAERAPAAPPETTVPEATTLVRAAEDPLLPASERTAEHYVAALRTAYVDRLGFPPELLEDGIDIEADLGVDSIKQLEVFSSVRTAFGLAEPSADVRVTAHTTLESLAELLTTLAPARDSRA
ncbi:acyltransferase domain-containing protein [Streptomyces argenteolus]|uniref:Acyltransferase domain-containing protein n=1 Tax=Streptomyces argenteolus TaxID=67274 RepID=A0ABW6XEG2_9ACTN